MPDLNDITWDMMTEAGIDIAMVHRDPPGRGYYLIKRDHMICFGPATTETGDAAVGWDITGYTHKDDAWVESIQEYELMAEDAVRKVADLAGPD